MPYALVFILLTSAGPPHAIRAQPMPDKQVCETHQELERSREKRDYTFTTCELIDFD